MESLRQDLRFGLRILRKSPAVTAVAVLTLGIAIGATTSIFSVVSALLLKPLPFPAPEQLVALEDADPNPNASGAGDLSWPEFTDLRDNAKVLSGAAAYVGSDMALLGRGEPQRVVARYVSKGFFDLLGAPPIAGRAFTSEEHEEHGPHAVMVSKELWHATLADAPMGTSLDLDGVPHTLVGVVNPAAEVVPGKGQVWLPFEERYVDHERGAHFFDAVARLAPGVSFDRGRAEIAAVAKNLGAAAHSTHLARIRPLRQALRGSSAPLLWLLLCAVGTVLLIAAVNLANVLLARASGRVREFAVRRALGASRFRLARQLLIESALIGLCGGAVGLLFALWGRDVALRAWPRSMPRLEEAPLDFRVLAFAAAISLVTGLAIGVLPAVASGRGELHDDLREGAGATSGRGRARHALVVAQSALATLLLIGAALLVQSFARVLHQDPGFAVEHALSVRMELPARKYPTPEKRAQFARDLVARVAALPGVRAAGVTGGLPMGDHTSVGDFQIVGRPPLAEDEQPFAEKRMVTSGYFSAMQIPVLEGRIFGDNEPTRVVVVNETLAKKIFPGQDPIGQRIDAGFFHTKDTDATIIGVVADVKQHDLSQPARMEIDFPYDQVAWAGLDMVVRATGDPKALTSLIKSAVLEVDPQQPVAKMPTMTELLAASVGTRRLSATLLGGFSLAALLLAALGIYGVVSYGVVLREREIGVRMALGAARGEVLSMVLREGVRLSLFGVATGGVVALVATRFLRSFLFGISATDPLTYLVVGAALLSVAALASFLPARRATHVDPASALRAE